MRFKAYFYTDVFICLFLGHSLLQQANNFHLWLRQLIGYYKLYPTVQIIHTFCVYYSICVAHKTSLYRA